MGLPGSDLLAAAEVGAGAGGPERRGDAAGAGGRGAGRTGEAGEEEARPLHSKGAQGGLSKLLLEDLHLLLTLLSTQKTTQDVLLQK